MKPYKKDAFKQMRGTLLFNAPLANFTTWKVGGPADKIFFPLDLLDLSLFLKTVPPKEEILWLGCGSNILVRDGGLRGTVIIVNNYINNCNLIAENTVYAGAGCLSSTLAYFCLKHNLTGLEFLAGIPGTVGGALYMNAGAYGGQTWDYVEKVATIDRAGNEIIRNKNEYNIGYRTIVMPKPEWFTAGFFTLKTGEQKKSQEHINFMLDSRKNNHPLEYPNAGSVFRNPQNNIARNLIAASGLTGLQIGGAQISPKHTNFIITHPGACAADIEKLISHTQEIVYQKQNIRLETEVKIVGGAA